MSFDKTFTIINIVFCHIFFDDISNQAVNTSLEQFIISKNSWAKWSFETFENNSSFEKNCLFFIFFFRRNVKFWIEKWCAMNERWKQLNFWNLKKKTTLFDKKIMIFKLIWQKLKMIKMKISNDKKNLKCAFDRVLKWRTAAK